MKKFGLLLKTRQSTEYSCGASALQAVLSYWGKDLGEKELMEILHTTPETGTYPEDIVRAARELGFEAEVKENLTIEDLEESTSKGIPVIALGQAWISQDAAKKALEEDWEDGHYIVILAVDKDYVYIEDPFIRMGKGFMPRQTIEEYWHNTGGKATDDKPKQMHLGIFIRGTMPAKPKPSKQVDSSKLDFSTLGPMHLIAVTFEGQVFPYDIMEETRPLLESGLIRPVAFLVLRKDKEGRLTAIEGGNLQDEEEIMEVNALVAIIAGHRFRSKESDKVMAKGAIEAASSGDFGLQVEDISKIGKEMPADSSALIMLFEHLWAKKLRNTLNSRGGVLLNQQIIKADTLAELGSKLAEGS